MFVGCAPAILRPLSVLAALRPQDYFATSVYTGNNAARTIDVGFQPDLSWFKSRSGNQGHALVGSNNPAQYLASQTTDSVTQWTADRDFTGFTSNGFSLGVNNLNLVNGGGINYAAWNFRQANKFFRLMQFSHTAGTADTFDLSALGIVGWAYIKNRGATGDWYAWNRSLNAGNNLVLNSPAAQSTTNAFISVSGTTLTFAAGAPSGSYLLEVWAHDPDGIVACGAGSATLPWNAQYVKYKDAGATGAWRVQDSARGFGTALALNAAAAEAADSTLSVSGASLTFSGMTSPVWLAIRAPT